MSGKEGQIQDWLAGDAVLIAPVSNPIPCYQGILQGMLRFYSPVRRLQSEKSLCGSRFLSNSLRRYQGIDFEDQRIF
jgi:hypothetical protein